LGYRLDMRRFSIKTLPECQSLVRVRSLIHDVLCRKGEMDDPIRPEQQSQGGYPKTALILANLGR